MKLLIINGPNINMLGIREPKIYGNQKYQDLKKFIKLSAKELDLKVKIYQSNSETKIIELIHSAHFKNYDGIIINPGAYTHYSYAIYDALKSINIPSVEVHLSDITNREEFRKTSVIKDACIMSFMGEGFNSYYKALEYFHKSR